MTSSLEGEGGGSGYPPKVMTSFMNSHLLDNANHLLSLKRGNGSTTWLQHDCTTTSDVADNEKPMQPFCNGYKILKIFMLKR